MSEKCSVKGTTAAKIGLFAAIILVINSTIGIGIFFKNIGVFTANAGNGWTILLSWLIAFFLAISVAIAFGELLSSQRKKVSNLGIVGVGADFLGKRVGRFLKIMYPIFYYPVFLLCISVFGAETIWNAAAYSPNGFNTHMVYILLIGAALVIFFMVLNLISTKLSAGVSQASAWVVFVPLLGVAIVGIVFGTINPQGNLFTQEPPYEHLLQTFPGFNGAFEGIIKSLPAIFFTFDSFVIVSNISGEVKNPQKNVPLAIIIGIICSGFLYVMITVGQIFVGFGNVFDVFPSIFGQGTTGAVVITTILSILVMISIFGLINSLCMSSIRMMQASIESEEVFFAKWFKNKEAKNALSWAMLATCIMIFFYWLAVGIPSSLVGSKVTIDGNIYYGTDAIIDGMSNLIAVLNFLVYSIIIMGGIVNRWTRKVDVVKSKLFVPFGLIGAIGCIFVSAYCLTMEFGYYAFTAPLDTQYLTWGLFLNRSEFLLDSNGNIIGYLRGSEILRWQSAVVFWSAAIGYFAIPFINDLIIKMANKKNRHQLLWEHGKNTTTIQSK